MIEIKEINKRFEDVQAVSDLTMKIVEGEIFGLVGTNGAGKSTSVSYTHLTLPTIA